MLSTGRSRTRATEAAGRGLVRATSHEQSPASLQKGRDPSGGRGLLSGNIRGDLLI